MRRRHSLPAALALFAPALHAQPETGIPQMDDPAPQPLGFNAQGAAERIETGLGKIQIVSFWATWCPHCKVMLAPLENLQRHLGPGVLRTALITGEDREVFRALVRRTAELKLQFLHDRDGSALRAWGSPKGVPRTFVVGHDGRIRDDRSGWGEDSGLQWLVTEINGALRARAAAQPA